MESIREAVGRHMTLPEAAADLRSGSMLLLYDDMQPGPVMLCLPAQFARPAALRTLQEIAQNPDNPIVLVLSGKRLDALRLPPGPFDTRSFAAERAAKYNGHLANHYATTIQTLMQAGTRPVDIVRPEALPILRPHPGGILHRRGMAEAALDLMRIAGLEEGAILCPTGIFTVDPDAFEALNSFAAHWHINLLSINTLLRYRREHQVSLITETNLPMAEATFRLLHFQEIETGEPYLVLTLGDIGNSRSNPPLLRLHSSCTTGDIFGSQRCDCQAQMHSALHQIAQEGRGIFLYLPQEGRGIGLAGKLQAYVLQEQGYDTLEANERLGYPIDARDYSCAIEILHEMGIDAVRLLTNNPEKIQAVRASGIAVKSVPLQTEPTPSNLRYLQTKQQRFGHMLFSLQESEQA